MTVKSQVQIALPQGYTASLLLPEYEQAAVDVINAFATWMYGQPNTTLEEMRNDWADADFQRDTDVILVLDAQGRVVGYSNIWDLNALHVRSYAFAAVDPALLGSGVEDFLLAWSVERAQQNVDKADPSTRVVLHSTANEQCKEWRAVLERHGMQVARNFYRMVIDLDQPIPTPEIPRGMVIRAINGEEELREAIRCTYESFKDHWGFVEEPFEAYAERWARRVKTDPVYDPALYFIALDGDEVAGVALCYPHLEEDPGMAWVGTLGVRREWRKRGLALALLRHAFIAFQQRGTPRAGLGVDASSMTGAVRLYEKAGMRVSQNTCMYELELRPGEDLMRKKLE